MPLQNGCAAWTREGQGRRKGGAGEEEVWGRYGAREGQGRGRGGACMGKKQRTLSAVDHQIAESPLPPQNTLSVVSAQ